MRKQYHVLATSFLAQFFFFFDYEDVKIWFLIDWFEKERKVVRRIQKKNMLLK